MVIIVNSCIPLLNVNLFFLKGAVSIGVLLMMISIYKKMYYTNDETLVWHWAILTYIR